MTKTPIVGIRHEMSAVTTILMTGGMIGLCCDSEDDIKKLHFSQDRFDRE